MQQQRRTARQGAAPASADRPARIGAGRRRWLTRIAVAALILVSAVRVIATYRVFTQFIDEPAHIACGLEWWQNGVYHLEPQHPPLARIFAAALPYFAGLRAARFELLYNDMNDALAASGRYAWYLALARLGTLPFWIVSCLLIFAIGRRLYGAGTALVALLLFSTLPAALGYAGLAYTDMALVAGMLCFAWRWAEFTTAPGFRNAAWLGAGVAFALCSKYSSIPYMGLAAALTVVCAILGGKIPPLRAATLRRAAGLALCISATAFALTWACFRFSLEPLSDRAGRTHPAVDRRLGQTGILHRAAYLALDTPVPLTEVARGVQSVYQHARRGHPAYTFGKVRGTGTFYYFPALLVFTIPVGLLVLSILGVMSLKRCATRGGDEFAHQALFAAPVAVALVNTFSTINIGYRHNLTVYAFVCLVGAVGCARGWRSRRFRMGSRLLVIALVGQHLISSAMAHPNYVPYFNFLAGSKPEEICAFSREAGDEWRLAARLRQLGAQHVCLAVGWPMPYEAFGLPPYTILPRNTPCQGWVAVGISRYHIDIFNSDPSDTGLAWLAPYQPAERVGTSILLYWIPASGAR